MSGNDTSSQKGDWGGGGQRIFRKRYPYKLMMTPDEKLKSLPDAQRFLKPGITFQQLDGLAKLFKTIAERSKSAA